MLRMDLALPTSRTWLNRTPQHVHSALHQPNSLLHPRCEGGPKFPSAKTRGFAILAPRWWNELPIDIRTADRLHTFRLRLKTHLFRLHFER
ncbi:hypothetical protein CgunFtcFv8_009659 [Champsocephalus gunnari]|uniref:Uncharacterized protein n=1 Tax=Champsocephalus gunnari TaxID=52237 RepID=A0AAN8GXW9_CHAGU|nr:hypothetical protein CgunFtcFv8_009659 [Champsocephalus gunnari]